MGKKHDKKAEPAAGKTPKGMKVDKAVKKFRKLEGKLWTREYLLKIAEFDGATIAPANGAAARADAMGTLAGEHHKLLTSEKSVELVRSLARETVAGGKIDDPQLLDEIRVLGRDQREASVIPTEEAEAWTRLTCEADAVWHKAKTANDWASFEPYVDRIVGQLKHQAELMDPSATHTMFGLTSTSAAFPPRASMRFAMRSRLRSCRSCTPSASAASSPLPTFCTPALPEAASVP